jgi:hypothetical protein
MLDDQAAPPRVTRDGYLAVTFERPPLAVGYMGGGLDGLILGRPVSHVERSAWPPYSRDSGLTAWSFRRHRRRALVPAPSVPACRATAQVQCS